MGIEGAAVDIVIVAPDDFEQVVPVLGVSGALAEEKEKLEFGGGEREGFLVEVEGEVVFVETKGAKGEDNRAWGGAIPFDDGLDAEEEFLGAEGLGEVVVGPGFQPSDAVVRLAFCGEHEDGNAVGAGVPLHFFENGVPIQTRKHEVENDEVRLAVKDLLQAFPAIVDHVDAVSSALEVEGNQSGDVHFIFDDQNLL